MRKALLLAAAALALAVPAFADSEPEVSPIQVKGDNVEYFHEEEKAVGTGHVTIDYEGSHLEADKITVYMKQKKAVAEGHVTLKQPDGTYTGERAEYDFDKKFGTVDGMTANLTPGLYVSSKKVERLADDHYRMTDASFTTCEPCEDSPFYRVSAKELDIIPGKKVIAKGAMILVKNVPILFVPVYVQPLLDFDKFPVQVIPGKNSDWGAFLLSKWRYEMIDTPGLTVKGDVQVDWRDKRGMGYGVENFYRGDVGRGAVRAYTIDDRDSPPDGDTRTRHRIQVRHQGKLAPDTTLTAEFNKLSDREVTKDFFFQEEYERDAFPDNYVSIITNKPEYTFSFLERERVDDFVSVVDRSPQLRFDTHTRRFAETPFYLRQEFQFDSLKKEFAFQKPSLDATRFDVNQTLYYDGQVGPVSVTPRVGTRQTYYSRRLEETEDLVRATFDPGLDVSTRFYKTYEKWGAHRWGLDWNGIRHIFTPTASYNFRPNPTAPRTILQQFDAIDALDKQNFIRFNFENKLQTKYRTEVKGEELRTRDLLRFIPFFDVDFDSHHVENVGYDLEFRPYTWVGIESDATYNSHKDQFETVNVDLFVGRDDDFQVGVGSRYVQNDSTLLTTEVRWRINPEYAVRAYERYEFQDGESQEFEVTLSKTFQCVIVDFTYNHRDGDTFFVALRLKGYPKVSFGLSQSYNRPKASPGRL